MRINEEQAEAIVRLQNNSDFQVVMEAMNAYRSELLEMTLYGSAGDVQTHRGMARSVTEVMRALGDARDFLDKRRRRK